jgi:hypothetical protein
MARIATGDFFLNFDGSKIEAQVLSVGGTAQSLDGRGQVLHANQLLGLTIVIPYQLKALR